MLKKKNKNTGISSGKKGVAMKLLGSFLVAVALFGVLVGVEKNLLSDYEKVSVILCKTDVPKGTKITKENVSQYFYDYEVDIALVNDTCIKDKNEVIDTVVEKSLSAHEILRKDDCTKEAEIYNRFSNPVEASITATNPGDIVSGTIRRGDYVDIAVVNKDTLEYDLILKKVYVVDAFTSTGEMVSENAEGTAATMLTVVEEKDNLAKFYSARETGNVIVTKLETEK
jgi:hypothetical protein